MKVQQMKKRETPREFNWTNEFENLYIVTYQTLYRRAKLIFSQEEKARELLILTYVEAYQRREQLQKEKTPIDWLIKRADFIAETKLQATREMLEASYAEEKMQSKEAKKENLSGLDEATVLLEIEERLGIVDEQEAEHGGSIAKTTVQGIFSFALLVIAVAALVVGAIKVKRQLDIIHEPFERTFTYSTGEDGGPVQDPQQAGMKENRVQVGDKVVYLSHIGQVLYSLPLEETDLAGESRDNPEIQKRNGWTYYLPCPEREDSQLMHVRPSLYHTLYRMKNDGSEIEIIDQEVDNYSFWDDGIYVSQYGRIQRIEMDDGFEKMKPGLYAAVEGDEIYLHDTLGRTLETEADGNIHYEDRIFEMSSNRIIDVRPDNREKGQTSYYLKAADKGNGIYCSTNSSERLFEERGNGIDSFCIAGDWMYYSAYIRRGGSGAHYSEIYKKSLISDEKAELIREEFTGRINQMYYSEADDQIYANYIPKNWKNNHGVIAVISLSGQMSCLEDEALRSTVETTGNDMLEFVMMQDGDVYCYWKDCYWEKGEKPVAMWRKVLVIPARSRVVMED